jgi:FMNH2-dependent dimethyl sulfone monooxygenase
MAADRQTDRHRAMTERVAAGARRTRMQNGNRFKLGLFGMNCSGSVATTAPERWNAGWPENREAARLADAAGIEFLLPVARWLGYGGLTDRQGTSFETLSWASALLAATKEIVAFATVHVPLVNPVFAAKSSVTADHVGRGRFGLNVVSGWNVDEFAMFGAQLLEHDDRYGYSEEWITVVKRIWSEEKPFDYSGKHLNLKNVGGKPKPWGGVRPLLMSAGSSPAGRAFASRHVDCLFMSITEEAIVADEIASLRAGSPQAIGVYASGHLMCRATPKETKEYYHYLVHEKGDWEAAKAAMLRRIAGDGRSLPQDRLHAMMERFISGGGTFPVIGSYDEVAATLKRLSDAGLDGMALASVNYVQEMPVIRDELLPRLERLGLREPLH